MLGSLFALQPSKDDAFNFMVSLNNSGMLALQAVAPLEKPNIIKPFADLSPQKAPLWWTGYNKTKHTLPEGMKKATLDNVINALGALPMLLQISYTRLLNSPHKAMLQSKNWKDVPTDFRSDYDRLKFESGAGVEPKPNPYLLVLGELFNVLDGLLAAPYILLEASFISLTTLQSC